MTDVAPREPHPDDWVPNPGPQERFLSLTCFEALYGGQVGGGKSDSILIDATRYVGRGDGAAYQALLLRRTFPDLEKSLILRSLLLYPMLGGRYHEGKKTWTFPGGERIVFGYLEGERDVFQYQGGSFPFIGFDELTHFSRFQYTYLISRCRSAHGIRCRMRATTNPGGEGHAWVFERWGHWLDPEATVKAGPGEILYFHKSEDGADVIVPKGTRDADGSLALGRTFVPAKLSDNPYLARDGAYARGLLELDPVTREQLRSGNWLIKPAAGLYFKRAWVADNFLDEAPEGLRWVRWWDLGATPVTKGKDPDWTSGVKMARWGDRYVIADAAAMRGGPGEVRGLVKATAELDGKACVVGLPQDPGQAGVDQVASYTAMLSGFIVRSRRPTGEKIVRFGPFSSQASVGNVYLVRGPWNARYIEALERFPEGHDDDADATSDAFAEVSGALPPPKLPAANLSALLPKRRL
jgi:predicted phage terminase large subunit-like protein